MVENYLVFFVFNSKKNIPIIYEINPTLHYHILLIMKIIQYYYQLF